MQVHLAATALSRPAYPDNPYLDDLVREPPGLTAWKTSLGKSSLIYHKNGEIYVPISGKVVSQKLLARYDRLAARLAVRAWELRSRAACGVEAWVKKIPAFLHLAHITSGGDDVEDLPEFQVLFHWQQRLLPFPSIELDRFLLILQLPATLRNLQFTDKIGDLCRVDHKLYLARESAGQDAVELLTDQTKLNGAFEQLEDYEIDQEQQDCLMGRFLMLCLFCRKEQLAGLRQRYNAAMVAAGYPTVDAAAREDGSAEAGEPGLRQLSGAVEASAASHVATAASAASSSPPQPDHCISSFEKEKAFSTMIQDSRQPAAHGHTNQADEEDNDVAM